MCRQVVIDLQVEPKLGGRTEGLGKEPGSFRGYSPTASDDLIDPLYGDTKVLCKGYLRNPHGVQEFELEDLSRMRGNAMSWSHHSAL